MTTWHYLWLVGLLVRPTTMLIIIERISIRAAGKYCDARLPAHAHSTLRCRPSRNSLNPVRPTQWHARMYYVPECGTCQQRLSKTLLEPSEWSNLVSPLIGAKLYIPLLKRTHNTIETADSDKIRYTRSAKSKQYCIFKLLDPQMWSNINYFGIGLRKVAM